MNSTDKAAELKALSSWLRYMGRESAGNDSETLLKWAAAIDALATPTPAPEPSQGQAPGERERFEAKFPVPAGVEWHGDGYEVKASHVNSYVCDRYVGRWVSWLAAKADALAATQQPAATSEPATDDFEDWWERWPFADHKNPQTKAAAHHAWRAGRSVGQRLIDCPNCLGDGRDGDADDYGRMVGFDCHQCGGHGKILAALAHQPAATPINGDKA